MLRLFRECDIFRKLPQEHWEAKAPSSPVEFLIRCVSVFIISVLVLNETIDFASPAQKQKFDIDMSEQAVPHVVWKSNMQPKGQAFGSFNPFNLPKMEIQLRPRQVRVILDMTINDFPCIDLSLDYQDVMGTRAVDVKTTIFKQRLHKNGTLVGETMKNDPKTAVGGGPSNPSLHKNNTGNATCGSCFGALDVGECCNSCSDVLYAYRLKRWSLPRIEDIPQCQSDGNSEKSAYQPPQIIRLRDYSSDDFMPKFTRLNGEAGKSGSEARVSTPFKLNFSFEPLKPLRPPLGKDPNGSAFYGFQPMSLNFSSYTPLSITDGDDDGFDGLDSLFKGIGSRRHSSPTPPPTTDSQSWPHCLWRNLIIHGWNEGEALMIDLTSYGAKEGCWNDDCTETDKFSCDTLERCSVVCNQVKACFWWTWGTEEGVRKCWLREGRSGREKRFGFASGHRLCVDPDLIKNTSDTTHDKEHEEETKHILADANTTRKPKKSTTTIAPAANGSGSDGLQSRRLSSWDDDIFDSPSFGSSLHMPVFGFDFQDRFKRKEQQDESCRIHGYFDMNKVPGNFHIGTHGAAVPSYMSAYGMFGGGGDSKPQNMEHVINKLAFVEIEHNETLNATQPLDGFTSPKAFTFQYYITLNPATQLGPGGKKEMEGYQFRSGSFVTNELIGPAVFFRLDIDPIRVTYYTEERRWSKYLVNVCAIIGGCLALCTMVAQFIENMFLFSCEQD